MHVNDWCNVDTRSKLISGVTYFFSFGEFLGKGTVCVRLQKWHEAMNSFNLHQ